ncbi:unnamed protein product [Spirodela intermedia]|nr:unnamed protein product [Spirodela intermedia]CAA6655997.1 unnamed protein product [Spirodela intermedia]
MRIALQQQMRDQLLVLTRRLDSKASTLLKQKEEDLARASKKTLELEECLKRAEAEGQTWKRIAKENEAMALVLQNTLEQVRDNPCRSSAAGVIPAASALGDDAASCCDSTSAAAAARPNGGRGGGNREGEWQGNAVSGRCRGCGSHDSCMLFMPCMHLCACELCDSLLDSCPVCRSAKQGSIEVFLS